MTWIIKESNRWYNGCVFAASAFYSGLEHQDGQIKDDVGCFSAKYTERRDKPKDGLSRNHDNVSE